MQIKSIIIPQPTLKFGDIIYTAHKVPFEIVACNLLSKSLQKKNNYTDKVIYLSRRKAKKVFRRIHGEKELENLLKSKGVLIFYPETLNLIDQIKLVNSSKTIIACKGSALHSLLFDISNNKNVIIIEDSDKIDISFPMIDRIKGYNTHYIGALSRLEINKPDYITDRIINVEFVIQKLMQLSIFKS